MEESLNGEQLPSPDSLVQLLKNTEIRQRLLCHPQIVEPLVAEAVRRSELCCSAVEERLAGFIDAQRSAADRSPEQWMIARHVFSCPRCYDLYALTCEILQAQQAGILPPWPQ